MTGRKLLPITDRLGAGYPYEKIKSFLKNSSLIFANLEAPLVKKENMANLTKQGKDKAVHLYGLERDARAMSDAGFNIVSLANNHILDYGQYGLRRPSWRLNRQVLITAASGKTACGSRMPHA